jgi:hypothetical protein
MGSFGQIDQHKSNFNTNFSTQFTKDGVCVTPNEAVGFQWSFCESKTLEYFKYYSLYTLEESKKGADFSTMYFIGVDLEQIQTPGSQYAVWYPNRNFLGAKEINDYITEKLKTLSELFTTSGVFSPKKISGESYGMDFNMPVDEVSNSPMVIWTEYIKSVISSENNFGYNGFNDDEFNVTGLISSGGIGNDYRNLITNTFLQATDLFGYDFSFQNNGEFTDFIISKFGGNDWFLSASKDVQTIFNPLGINMKVKENMVSKDGENFNYSMLPYAKKDGFSYIYIGRVI